MLFLRTIKALGIAALDTITGKDDYTFISQFQSELLEKNKIIVRTNYSHAFQRFETEIWNKGEIKMVSHFEKNENTKTEEEARDKALKWESIWGKKMEESVRTGVKLELEDVSMLRLLDYKKFHQIFEFGDRAIFVD